MSKDIKNWLYPIMIGVVIAVIAVVTKKWWLALFLAFIPNLASWALRREMSEGGTAMNRIRWGC